MDREQVLELGQALELGSVPLLRLSMTLEARGLAQRGDVQGSVLAFRFRLAECATLDSTRRALLPLSLSSGRQAPLH